MGNLVFSGTQWLITVALARLGSISMVGQYALGQAVCTPIFAFTGLQMRAVQATDCNGTYQFRDYLTVRIVGTACAIAAVGALSWLMPWRRDTVLVVLAVACSKAIESFSDVLYGLFQLHDRLDQIAIAMAIRGIAGLTALTLVMFVFGNSAAAVAGLSAMWMAALLLYERPVALRIEGSTVLAAGPSAGATSRQLASRCMPLAFVLLLLTATASLPRVLLERDAGEHALGVFSAVAAMSGAIGLLYSALGQTALPRMARMFAANRGQFRRTMGRLMLFAFAVGLPILAGAWFWGAQVVELVYGKHTSITAGLVTGLVAVGVLANTSSLLGVALTASGRFWSQLAASMMILAVTAAASIWLIPGGGERGAMYAGLTGAVFQLFMYGYMCWRQPA
jgi:O-antigen/teichoic acid export membrane protein